MCIRVGLDTFRLMIGVVDPAVESVIMHTSEFLYQGNPIDNVVLYDDASHGDDVAGDSVFTANELTLASADDIRGFVHLFYADLTLLYLGGNEEMITEDLSLTITYLDESVQIPIVEELAVDVRASDYAVNIVTSLKGGFPTYEFNTATITQRYYDLFADDRDFLMLAYAFNTAGSPKASFQLVNNDVRGIGQSLFDDSRYFGSDGILQGIIGIFLGYASSFPLNHELTHRWAAFLDPSLDLATGGHWDNIERPTGGLGNCYAEFINVSGNTYRGRYSALGDSAYNDLELYLMGMISISEVVTPIRTLVDPILQECLWENDPVEGWELYCTWTVDVIREVSTDEIVELHGMRVPSHLESQKDFTSALIVVSDRPLTDVELAYWDFGMREYEKPSGSIFERTFEAATGGRATLSTRLNRRDLPINPSNALTEYRFDGSLFDSSGNRHHFIVNQNVSFENNALYLNDVYEFSGEADAYIAETPIIPELDYS